MSPRLRQILLPVLSLSFALVFVLWRGQPLLADNRSLVAGTDGQGVSYWNGTYWQASPSLPVSGLSVSAVGVDSSGEVWVGTYEGDVYSWNGSWVSQGTPAGPYRITALVVYGGGMAVASFGGGVVEITSKNISLGNPNGDPDVTALAVDGTGALWAGTQSQGLAKWSGNAWVDSGFHKEDPITALLYQPSTGSIWVGTRFTGAWYGSAGSWQNSSVPYLGTNGTGVKPYFAWDSVQDLALDVYGHVWAATSGGLYVYNGSSWASVVPYNAAVGGLPGYPGEPGQVNQITGLGQGQGGDMWAGTADAGSFNFDYPSDSWITEGNVYSGSVDTEYVGQLVYALAP